MKQTKKYKQKQTKKQVKEPSVAYRADGRKELSVFSSFQEAEEDNYKWLSQQSPEQHLINAVKLIKRIYADDLKKHPVIERKLTIVK